MTTTPGLRRLADVAGTDFPARDRTASELEDRRRLLAELPCDPDVAVVLMGSWGRSELSAESDDDFVLLVNGRLRHGSEPTMEAVGGVLGGGP